MAMRGGGPGRGYHGSGRGRHFRNEKPTIKITNRRMLAWFYRMLAPYWARVLFGVGAMVGGTAFGLWTPILMKQLIDDAIIAGNADLLPRLIGCFLLATVGSQVLLSARSIVMHLLGQRLHYQLRVDCYRHLMTLGLNYFERQQTGDVMSRVSNDVAAVEHLVVHGSDEIISNVLKVAGAIVIMFAMAPVLALIALSPLPFFIAGLWVFAIIIRPIFGRIRIQLGDINTQLQERLSGIQVIKAFSREQAEIEDFEESSHTFWRLNAKTTWMWGTFFPSMQLMTTLGMVAMVWYGAGQAIESAQAKEIGAGVVTAGVIVAFMRYLRDFYQPIGSLARAQNMINNALASIERIFELSDEVPSVKDKDEALELDTISGRVEIEGVSFKYDTGETVLRDVSVTAEPGETIAIVGRSGAGKTSLVNLIPRFYDPIKGRVLVDGNDLRDVSQASLRRHIGIVLQETYLFNATARDNIRYARPDATEDEIVAAAKAAYADEFIVDLQDGYDTLLGERGVRLSGGQKQRIAIARAVLKDPELLIFDEATSSLDSEAERLIQEALELLIKGRTVIIIAHRLSTVRYAGKILVIDKGEIVEEGSHEELMSQEGEYKHLHDLQYRVDPVDSSANHKVS